MSFHQFLIILAARKRTIAGTVLAAVAIAIAITLVLPARYKATASVVIDFRGLDLVGGTLMPAQMLPGYLATQIDIIESRNVALKVVEALRLDQSAVAQEEFRKETQGRGAIQSWLAELLLKNLDVKPAPESSVLHISFTGRDPEFAAAVANAFARGYITTNLELRVEPAKQTAAWFDLRAKALREEMESAQTRLSAYQKEKGIVATEERFDTESNRLEQLSLQLSQQQALTYDALIRQRQAKEFTQKGGSIDQLPDVLASQLVSSLKSDLSRLEGKLKETQSRYGANHPQSESISAEVESTRQKLKTEMAGVGVEPRQRLSDRAATRSRAPGRGRGAADPRARAEAGARRDAGAGTRGGERGEGLQRHHRAADADEPGEPGPEHQRRDPESRRRAPRAVVPATPADDPHRYRAGAAGRRGGGVRSRDDRRPRALSRGPGGGPPGARAGHHSVRSCAAGGAARERRLSVPRIGAHRP